MDIEDLLIEPDDSRQDDYRDAFADWLACAVGGVSFAPGATVFDDGLTGTTAWVGTAGHYLDFDDTYLPGMVHLSAPVAPAALVTGVHRGATVGDVVSAYASGIEAMGALSRASNPEMYDRGWHSTSVCGGFGAAVAAAMLLDVPPALAGILSLTSAAGMRSAFGTDAKSLQVGMAAAAGVTAARLAGMGATANTGMLTADNGFFRLYAGVAGHPDRCSVIADNWIKAYPCCLQTHTTVEAALRVRGSGAEVARGAPVELRLSPLARKAAWYDVPTTPLEAKFSPAYTFALTLLYGRPTVKSFATMDPDALRLSRDVRVVVDPDLIEPEIVLTTAAHAGPIRVPTALGSPARPMTREQLRTKARELTGCDVVQLMLDDRRPAAELMALLDAPRDDPEAGRPQRPPT